MPWYRSRRPAIPWDTGDAETARTHVFPAGGGGPAAVHGEVGVMVDLAIPPGFDLLSEDLQSLLEKGAGKKGAAGHAGNPVLRLDRRRADGDGTLPAAREVSDPRADLPVARVRILRPGSVAGSASGSAGGGGASHPGGGFSAAVGLRRQFRRSLAAQHRSLSGNVAQLRAGPDAAQHQPAATHVAAADELGGEKQPLADDGFERLCVLRFGNTAEQHDLALRTRDFLQAARVALER